MAKSHKGQHWIPTSYLSAWADPDTPTGHKPYVHVFSSDGGSHKRRAPDNIFKETDLYTIKLPDGSRDLVLENGLSQLEQAFASMRRDFLSKRRPLPAVRHFKLLVFVAAMHVRTPAMRDHHGGYWKEVRDMAEELEAQMRTVTPEQKRRAASLNIPRADRRRSLSLDQVRKIAENPMQQLLRPFIAAEAQLLPRLAAKILCTSGDPGFITSDNPVVWFNPEAYKLPPMFRSPAMKDRKLEITIPVSPSQVLMLHHGAAGLDYVEIPSFMVAELNRRTRAHCDKEFVVRRKHTEPFWFEMGELPDDAWQNTEGGAAAEE